MKTYHITDLLKKELLLVELPEDTQFDVLVNNPLWKDGIKFITGTDEKFNFIKGSFSLLGKPDEIREDDAKELVEKVMNGQHFQNYKGRKEKDFANLWCKTALQSFNSALESEIYWDVNPISKQLGFIGNVSEIDKQIALQKQKRRFEEAQEKTFDKSRTLIFVTN